MHSPTANELRDAADYLEGRRMPKNLSSYRNQAYVAAWLRSVADDHVPDATKMVRDDGLEEAAQVVERCLCEGSMDDRAFTIADAAQAIRALKGKS